MSRTRFILRWFAACIAAAAIGWGGRIADPTLAWFGGATLTGLAILVVRDLRLRRSNRSLAAGVVDPAQADSNQPSDSIGGDRSNPSSGESDDSLDSVVRQMFADGRFALLLRPQIAGTLDADSLNTAQEELDRRMALVPDGDVQLEPNRLSAAAELDVPEESLESVTIHVAATFLDRHPVTNRQYQAFVEAGGYEQMAIWDPAVWPAVLDFVDTTGKPGPRYWLDGHCPPGKEEHPVVGICWYEAAAYARWVGQRLPTDAEWVKAASWPVNIPPATYFQRKYPWGNTMERQRANLWGSGPGDTVPVEVFAAGVSVGGVYQLIGNVWEWTADDFLWIAKAADETAATSLLKTVRGGAFDTYFDNQATSQFASGENPLGRKHNVGFRCALGICDLAGTAPEGASPEQLDEEQEELEVA